MSAESAMVSVRHHVPGRTRLSFRIWPSDDDLGRLETQLRGYGAAIAAASARTKAILFTHDQALSPRALSALVARFLSGSPGGAERAAEESCRASERVPPVPASAQTDLLARLSGAPCIEVLREFRTTPAGLTSEEARERLVASGLNTLPSPGGRSRLKILAGQFTSVPVALLIGSAVLSVVTGGLLDGAVTAGVIVLNAAIGFLSEDATERLIRRLSRPPEHVAAVLRDGRCVTLPAREVAPGDVLVLAPGSMVAADARILECRDLSVDESMLTGESLPVSKTSAALLSPAKSVAERHNIVHAGTVVTGGDGMALVFATGRQTEMAATRALIGLARPPRPAIEQKLETLGTRLAIGCLGASGLIFLLGLARGEPLVGVARSAIALAVSAIPEGLPAVATTTLALGARAMEREGAFVRALPVIQSIGTIDTICLDKTGTLTENRMAVAAARVETRTFDFTASDVVGAPGTAVLRDLAEAVSLCSEASLAEAVGSSTELALLEFARASGIDPDGLRGQWPAKAVRSRNHRRRWMATEHDGPGSGRIFVKGAPDELLQLSRYELVGGEPRDLTDESRRTIAETNLAFAGKGLRVLGVARGEGPLEDGDPDGLVWLGLVALADPIRPEARDAIATFHKAGVRTIIITGDQPPTALAVAEQLAISRTGVIAVAEGADIAGLDRQALGELAQRTSVFARVSPADKLRIVEALQHVGHHVAMIGDGINDGPALRAASVGVAMGKRGTDVAREVADIVIAHDDLRELARAIARGRATEDNMRASIRYFFSTNLSEVLVMLAETLHGRGEAETPMELLWLNLVTDILPGLGLAMAEPRGDVLVRPPRPDEDALFSRSEAADIVIDAGGMAAAALAAHFGLMLRAGIGPRARTATFLTLAITQIAHAWVLRDRSPNAGKALTISERRLEAALAGAGALLAAPFALPQLQRVLGIQLQSLGDLALSGALAAASFGAAELRYTIAAASKARAHPS